MSMHRAVRSLEVERLHATHHRDPRRVTVYAGPAVTTGGEASTPSRFTIVHSRSATYNTVPNPSL